MIDGAFPEHLRADAATFHHIMQSAPHDGLDVGDMVIDADFVAELDRALQEAGRMRWTALIRDPTGACVGGTEVTFEPSDGASSASRTRASTPRTAGSGSPSGRRPRCSIGSDTSAPRRNGSAPSNAFSNAAMLAINDALGFKAVSTRTEWQANVDEARRALSG